MIDLEPSWEKYTLADTFNFTPEDLEANRRGVMSERQKRYRHDSFLMRQAFIGFVVVGIPLIYIYTLLPDAIRLPFVLLILIIASALLFIYGPKLRDGRVYPEEKFTDKVDSVIGVIDVADAILEYKFNGQSRQQPTAIVAIGDHTFYLSPRKFYLFDKTKRYRAYFTTRPSNPHIDILSIEEVPDEQI